MTISIVFWVEELDREQQSKPKHVMMMAAGTGGLQPSP